MVENPPSLALALEHHQAGRLDEADAIYRRILKTNPDHADGIHLHGLILFQKERPEEALEWIRRAVALVPETVRYQANLGRISKAAGHLDEAAGAYRRVLALDPDNAEALSDLGAVLVTQDHFGEAADCCRRAVALNPNLAEVHYNLALALQGQGQNDGAETAFRGALAINAAFPDALYHLGQVLHEGGSPDEALDCFRRAVELNPEFLEAHCGLGNLLYEQGQERAAQAAYRRALDLAPERAEIHGNMGVVLHETARFDAALESFARALTLHPNDAEVRRNRAQTLLLTGRLTEGWKEYEWRWRTRYFEPLVRDFGRPAWDGSEAAGKRILIHAEQGYGDTIQFIRYAPMVAAKGGCVIVESPPRLEKLIESMPAVEVVVARGEEPPPFDLHVPLLSLPKLFATTLQTIPAEVPYLIPAAAAAGKWRKRMARSARARVGLAWQGDPRYPNDRRRSPGLEPFLPLFETPGVDFYSVQTGPGMEALGQHRLGGMVEDLGPELGDFADTAAAFVNLDLLITSDTAVPHLAGALGKPVWLALPYVPDWRWLMEGEKSPWYPTMRLFRQTSPGDWDGVFDRVARALLEICRGGAVTPPDQRGMRGKP
ncbi:MAG: tetratricopeptide repeat protein [Rhodospirillales bacterium]|nr:tetratricopeptide repeat protein [Rhodospirillales bacterium]